MFLLQPSTGGFVVFASTKYWNRQVDAGPLLELSRVRAATMTSRGERSGISDRRARMACVVAWVAGKHEKPRTSAGGWQAREFDGK